MTFFGAAWLDSVTYPLAKAHPTTRGSKSLSHPTEVFLPKRPEQLLLGDYLSYLLPALKNTQTAPGWPPDMFALCMGLLCKSGSYCRLLEDWPPGGPGTDSVQWASKIAEVGLQWRVSWPWAIPPFVSERWETIMKFWGLPVSDIVSHTDVAHALLELSAVSDEASEGFWLPGSPATPGVRSSKAADVEFFEHAYSMLHTTSAASPHSASTLCEQIDPSRLCVLPKCRTPQNGLTSRSLSHHLALCSADEIKPRWVMAPFGNAQELSLNFLLVPWPRSIKPVQFRPAKPLKTEMRNMPPSFGFFTYEHLDTSETVKRLVEDLHEAAVEKIGRIDAVVVPEAALTQKQHDLLSESVLRRGSFLISGVGEGSTESSGHGKNLIYIDFPSLTPLTQHKHHRWKLDQPQIAQYGLGSRIYPEKLWWEHISLGQRQLNFVAVMPWLVMSVLICEDLARPDPVGDLVRAVGPNLVIALLMDGPQLKERWGARYATTLADDPGCSVLTLTSAGMCGLSRAPTGAARSRVIALWKDAKTAAPIEVELPEESDGIILSLSIRKLEEWTADGRSDRRNAGYPILSGIHYVSRPSK